MTVPVVRLLMNFHWPMLFLAATTVELGRFAGSYVAEQPLTCTTARVGHRRTGFQSLHRRAAWL